MKFCKLPSCQIFKSICLFWSNFAGSLHVTFWNQFAYFDEILQVSFMSAILILGTPAEMYTAGTEYFIYMFGIILAIIIAGQVFVPLLFPLRLTSSFEVNIAVFFIVIVCGLWLLETFSVCVFVCLCVCVCLS